MINMSDPKLHRKVALITGGGSGIGRAVCQLFAKEGASIFIVDLNEIGMNETMDSLKSEYGNMHGSIKGDVSDNDDVVNAFKSCEKVLGARPTILVNAAGVTSYGYMGQLSVKDINFVIDVNLKGTILASNEFVKCLPQSNEEVRGVIVNIASVAGEVGTAASSVYSASKFGVVGITKSISAEFAMHKVRCNAVLPGFVDTPMYGRIDNRLAPVSKMVMAMPYGRVGQPEEIAKACLYLASKDSSFVCGASLDVAGGGDTPYILRPKL